MCKVLIVDDCTKVRMKAELMLRHAGRHDVHAVGSESEAVEVALADPPDVIVLSVSQATTDGSETLQKLRMRSVACPVVAYVEQQAQPQWESTNRNEAGFSAFVSKAKHMSCLLATVRTVASSARR